MEKKEPQITFGRTLSGIRKLKRLTQGKLSERAGKAAVYISAVETGRINPTLDTILCIAEALEIEPADIFSLAFSSESKEIKTLKKEFDQVIRKLDKTEQQILIKIIRAMADKSKS
jgi:transcriptional regulator with XRE-family HTH domain